MTNIVAIVQARMSSQRLPGKVLKPLGSKPALACVLHQLSGATLINHIVLATSMEDSDAPLVQWARRAKVDCSRGSLTDVLDRYYQAALHCKADVIVRITADCPLLDPTIVDKCVERFLQGDCDYATNTNPPTFPDGLDNEVLSFAALERAWKEATLPAEREHVTPYIRNHPELFRLANVENPQDYSKMRWTLDTPEDYAFLNRVIQRLEMNHIREQNPRFTMQEVLELLSTDKSLLETAIASADFAGKERYFSSLQQDYMPRL
jgi:spore coat polysaccharide biosynthesis protein SpsF (cytidylyltransferase family)